ncbi:MAG: UDP-glucose 4-epimerase GalE [Rhodospirillales bacterium]|nr:UDP-glucose 4-epimerase GalE [Rhodospirillales bacterium]
MALLITGGAGYIGSHMAYACLDCGLPTVVVDDLSNSLPDFLPKEAAFYRGDVADRALLERIFAAHSIDCIVHFAGSVLVPESVDNPLKYYKNNTGKTQGLLVTAIVAGIKRFIFSSTAAVYGAPGSSPIPETAEPAPLSPYGNSKLMSETMIRDAAAAHGLSFGILRYFNVAGADPKMRTGQSSPNATHLIKVASQAAHGQRNRLEIFGSDYPTPDGTCVRDYIHVSDLAAAHVLAVEHLAAGGGSFTANCGYGQGFSVKEVIAVVKKVTGKDFPVMETPRRVGDPPSLVAEAGRIRRLLGWVPQHNSLEQIVKHAFAWEGYLASLQKCTAAAS